jgi:RND family efflux transporter MFP subunit
MDAMNMPPHVFQRVSSTNVPTNSAQNRAEKLITPRRFWSEKTMTIMKFIALGLAAGSVALSGCSKSREPDSRTQPISVLVARVGAPVAEAESFTGVVTARVQSDLGFRVPGKVTKRFVDMGQKVRVGQPLMQIDVTDYAHAIATQTENVAALRAKAKQAASDEVRYRGLVSTGAIAASTYDEVKATADAGQAQLASAEAQEKVARDQGDYSLLLADSDGTVVQTLAEPGQVVAAGQTVIKLAHAGPREAAVYLPETLRPALGSLANAVLYGETATVPVRLRQLSDSSDPETRTFEARYVLGSLGANAPLGATVTVHVPKKDSSDPEEVPIAAITDRGNGPGVWVLNQKTSTVSFQKVTVLRLNDEYAILSDGVQPGEQIVALGAHLLSDGQQVRVADEKVASR